MMQKHDNNDKNHKENDNNMEVININKISKNVNDKDYQDKQS